eukprot:1789327-Prymnesium_polylepis.1
MLISAWAAAARCRSSWLRMAGCSCAGAAPNASCSVANCCAEMMRRSGMPLEARRSSSSSTSLRGAVTSSGSDSAYESSARWSSQGTSDTSTASSIARESESRRCRVFCDRA